jgi:hypothetical protein
MKAPVRLGIVLLVALAAGFPLPALDAAPRAPDAGTQRMIERLQALDAKADPIPNPYLRERAIALYRERIAAKPPAKELLQLRKDLATALVNNNQPAEALRELDLYDQMLNLPGLQPTPAQAIEFFELRAVTYLRLGELENCLDNHNADSCVFPIQGGGIHRLPQGSHAAIEALHELLEFQPTPNAIWLLNVAYMTLGEYPDGVPAQYRLPPEKIRSEYDLPKFPDIAARLGLDVYDLAGGVAMDDFDGDGWLDLVTSAAGPRSQIRYFHNNGDGTFTELTAASGLTGLCGGLNLNHTDYDNDGDIDILVLRGGWQGNEGSYPNSLLRNNGDNTFTDVTEQAGLLSFHPTQTAAWFDFNGDGWLDLFIGNESIPPLNQIHPCELYRNNGDGTFTECATENGVAFIEFVKGVNSGDFNNDGRPDLYVSSRGFPNRLLRNDGPAAPDGGLRGRWKFTDVAPAAGVTEPLQSFPCWFFDYDNDGWLDIFVSGYFITNAGDVLSDLIGARNRAEKARLYRNRGDGTFTDVTKEAGLSRVLHTMGSNFGDLDNDGWLDFYLGTGDPYLGTLIPNRMFRNDGGRRFQDVTTAGGFGQLQKGHAIAFGDMNNDGGQDIYSVVGGVYQGDVYHNQFFANPGFSGHSLKLKLVGVKSNRAAIGARIKVVVRTADGAERAIHRLVGTGSSFGGNPLRQEIGLGEATAVQRVEIFWPATGKTQVLTGFELDHGYRIREDNNLPEPLGLRSFAWPEDSGGGGHQHHHGAGDKR